MKYEKKIRPTTRFVSEKSSSSLLLYTYESVVNDIRKNFEGVRTSCSTVLELSADDVEESKKIIAEAVKLHNIRSAELRKESENVCAGLEALKAYADAIV